MNGRKLYREYLKSLGCDCKEFIKLEPDWYESYDVHYKDSTGAMCIKTITHKPFVDWIIRNFSNGVWEHFKNVE